jgi:hypothetical protein
MEVSSRSVDKVIKQVLEIIPPSEKNLIKDLNKYYESLWNQAPEALTDSYCWIPFGQIMNNHIQDDHEEWKKKVIKIFMNTP